MCAKIQVPVGLSQDPCPQLPTWVLVQPYSVGMAVSEHWVGWGVLPPRCLELQPSNPEVGIFPRTWCHSEMDWPQSQHTKQINICSRNPCNVRFYCKYIWRVTGR